MDKAKIIIEICNLLPVSKVRELLSSLKENPNSEVFNSPNWKRIIKFSEFNKICEFEGNLPIQILPINPRTSLAEAIKYIFDQKIDIYSEIALPPNLLLVLQNVTELDEDQPFIRTGKRIKIKDSWLFLFEKSSESNIYHWLNNFFCVSTKFYSSEILQDAIIHGTTQWNRVFGEKVKAMFDLRHFDPQLFMSVMTAMHQSNIQESAYLNKIVSDMKINSVLDIGGATGTFSRNFAKDNLTKDVFVYEKDDSVPLFEKISNSLSLTESGNFSYIAGNFFQGPNDEGLFGISKEKNLI